MNQLASLAFSRTHFFDLKSAPLLDDEFEPIEDDFADDEDAGLDCLLDEGGDCDKSGSLDCDFQCPFRDQVRK